jgi:hypothetical protein
LFNNTFPFTVSLLLPLPFPLPIVSRLPIPLPILCSLSFPGPFHSAVHFLRSLVVVIVIVIAKMAQSVTPFSRILQVLIFIVLV